MIYIVIEVFSKGLKYDNSVFGKNQIIQIRNKDNLSAIRNFLNPQLKIRN